MLEAASLASARSELAASPVDVILLDLRLGNEHGTSLLVPGESRSATHGREQAKSSIAKWPRVANEIPLAKTAASSEA